MGTKNGSITLENFGLDIVKEIYVHLYKINVLFYHIPREWNIEANNTLATSGVFRIELNTGSLSS